MKAKNLVYLVLIYCMVLITACGVCGVDVCVQRSWQMLTGESPVVVKVGQPLSQ